MANLSTKRRNALPKSTFGLPGERKYPMPDRAHAANAKARASQQEAKGNLSSSAKAQIDAKADRILDRGKKTKSSDAVMPKPRRTPLQTKPKNKNFDRMATRNVSKFFGQD